MKVLSNGTQSTIASSSSSPSSSLSPSASLTTSPNTSGGQQPQQISPSSNKSPSSQKPTDSSGLIVENASKDEIKNLIIQSLVAFNDDYFNNNSRCVILCALTCFIYDEILNQRWNIKRLNEAIKRIFKDLDFRDVNHSFPSLNLTQITNSLYPFLSSNSIRCLLKWAVTIYAFYRVWLISSSKKTSNMLSI